MKYILSKVTAVLCQSDEDVKRFCQLGLAQDKVQMAGNLKFDGVGGTSSHNTNLMPPVNLQQRKCWIAASTHPGEEELVLQAHKRLLQKYPDLILILAPRHPERKMEISKLIATQGLTDVARSENVPITLQHQVFLLDTLGELNSFYRLTAIAFVGGSLVKHGGHNMLEPIMAGAAVLTGPHVHNFTYIYKQLKSIDGMYTVENQAQLAEHVQMLLDKPEVGKQQVDIARGFVEQHQGATQKHLQKIELVLAKS
jgi:3-deoxy-D-manno-octulosonic-acid transferase